ncbi:MAG: recombinase family protein [Nanoarchaeota archaeon]|nr:recombinase family protein [Nanoarchaeota archaeon]
MEQKKKISIYVRVSSDEQKKEGYSIQAQLDKLYEYAKFKGWEVFRSYKDEGVSGKSIKGRKEFKQMLLDAHNEKFSAILIYKFDRAFRNVKEALITLDELRELGVDFISISENIDTTSAMGKFFFVVISGFAELERQLTSERLGLTLESKFNKGIIVGRVPTGYKWNKKKKIIVINDKKVDMVKDVFHMTLAGEGYRKVCDKYGISHQSYYNMIRNRVYIGDIEFNGKIKKGTHPKIIEDSVFNKVNGIEDEKETIE